MNKTNLKDLIQECITEIHAEQNTVKILREDFNKDVDALEEQQVLCEGLVQKGVLTEEQVDEAFFDTVKNLGKNAIAGVASAWKKAKTQGNKDEMARLEKKLAALKTKAGGTKAGGNTKQKQQAKQKVVAKAGETILSAVAKQDPKTAAAIKKAGPAKIAAALKNPKVKAKVDKIAKQVAAETPADPKQGFLGKVAAWVKKNPVKGVAAIALLGVVATAAAVGSGGVLPLMGTMLASGAKGAAIGSAAGGALKGGIALAKGQGLKAAAKEFGQGALQGSKAGFIGGAAGGFLGSALQGFSQGFQQLMSAGSGTVNTAELTKAQQTLDTKAQEIPKSQEIAPQQKSVMAQEIDRMKNEMMVKAKALNSLGLTKAQVFNVGDGNFKIVGGDGASHIFDKAGAEITDPNIVSKLNADSDSFRKAFSDSQRAASPVSPGSVARTRSDF